MESDTERISSEYPCRVNGWLKVWDIDAALERRVFADGNQPLPLWVPVYVVLDQDMAVLECFRSEETAEAQNMSPHLSQLRFDGGKKEFDKRWGYGTLESIKENVYQYYPDYDIGADRYHKGRPLETGYNESLPDLSPRSYDFEVNRGPMLFKKIFHSSYEKVSSERRGSVPLVPRTLEEDTMEEPSTPSKIASFFKNKGLKSNLKRTKSVTKLDRKRSPSRASETESTGAFVANLKRSMSLSRLSRKRNRHKPAQEQNAMSIISSRIRSSHSHESLLTSPTSMDSVDLNSSDLEIKPLHSSILGQDHCFQVSTSNGSKYISCRTAEEREKWILSLRKTVEPHQEQSRRTDNSLKLWIVEAKNVAPKKRYFCEVCLDRTLYARTSTKTKADMLFWGEHFEFNNLPAVDVITVNLFREADRKKKKDKNLLLGYINLLASDLRKGQLVEKWFTTASGTVGRTGKESKTELPIIRLKAKYQTVEILPMDMYTDFIKYISTEYCLLSEIVEPLVNVHDKENIATTLVHVMQKLNKGQQFLTDVVMGEISRLDNHHLTFRGNSIATKAMEAYMKLVGEKYLHDTLGEFVKTLINSPEDCEVDPAKVPNTLTLQRNQNNLIMYCEMVWAKLMNSYCYFPNELKEVFQSFREKCSERNKEELSDNLISASIFLRFLCPAILSPSLFNLTQEYPQEKAGRNLTLIAKTIQTLANFTKFGGKEEFMTFMNDFVEREWSNMKNFLKQISTTEGSSQFMDYDGYIDMGKELSILHSLLVNCLSNAEACQKLGNLSDILAKVSQALHDPNVGSLRRKPNRKSQIYDNLVNMSGSHPNQGADASSTEALKDILRNCGEDVDETPPPFTERISSTLPNIRHEKPSHVMNDYNDEYVSVRSSYCVRHTSKEVSNVSVTPGRSTDKTNLNQSWSEIVSAAEVINGDYIDLISFMDENSAEQNSSSEMDQNIHGSQMSISQISTVASSGYQSFGLSQSSSPVDSSSHTDHDSHKNSNEHLKPSCVRHNLQPVSFSNPMYSHHVRSKVTPSPLQQTSSSSSLSSTEEANSVKHISPIKSNRLVNTEPIRKYSQTSSSSSGDEFHDKPKYNRSNSLPQNGDLRFSLPLRSSSPKNLDLKAQKIHASTIGIKSSCDGNNTVPRSNEMWHSMDSSHFTQMYSDGVRRTPADCVVAQTSKSLQSVCNNNSTNIAGRTSVAEDNSTYSNKNRRVCTSPQHGQNAVHLGIRSVQRKIHEQEKTKQEYENEVAVLKQQLVDAQKNLHVSECRLSEHESGTQQLIEEWQHRLVESEERLRLQQAQKDDRMKSILQRLITVEDELRSEQRAMQKQVEEKQRVIEAQEQRIRSLDQANSKLVTALTQLKEQYNSTQSINGMRNSMRTKLSELGEFKTSSC